MNQPCDVLIVGGGMVGAALAASLSDSGLKIVIVDAGKLDFAWPLENFDLRVSAITRASQNFLETIGAWPGMQAARVFPYQRMHVWDATGSGEIHFDCADAGEPALGHIVENSVIQGGLLARLRECPTIELIDGVKPQSMQIDDESATLRLEDGRQITARLLVGADGARSWVRNSLNIETTGWAYQQNGLVTTVELDKGHQETAWQRFLPTGPLAFLPLDEKHCSIVWSTTEDETQRLLGLDDEAFIAELNIALGESELGTVCGVARRGAFPLRLQHTHEYVRPRVALIGDAAHTIHPLAGQGVNLGFLDAALLGEVIFDAHVRHKDIGLMSVLRRYERGRKSDNVLMMTAMDGFKRLFSNENKALSSVRNMGLNAANSITPLKQLFVQHAMGTGNRDLPRLSRGQQLG